MSRIWVVLLGLVIASAAVAQDEGPTFDGGFTDLEGDADAGHDLLALRWSGVDGHIEVDLAQALDADAGLTVVLYMGDNGTDEPDDAYILHTGPSGDRALSVRGNAAPSLSVVSNGTTAVFTTDPWDSPCAFVVAQTVTYPEGGQNVEDRIGAEDIGDAWDNGQTCALDFTGAIDDTEDQESPGVGMALTAVLLASVVAMIRRSRP